MSKKSVGLNTCRTYSGRVLTARVVSLWGLRAMLPVISSRPHLATDEHWGCCGAEPRDRGAWGPLQAWPQPLLLPSRASLHPACHRQCESLAPAGVSCGLKTWITPSKHPCPAVSGPSVQVLFPCSSVHQRVPFPSEAEQILAVVQTDPGTRWAETPVSKPGRAPII